MTCQYDPWGPISSVLYGMQDSDFVKRAIGFTGVQINWPILDERTDTSHRTRIRAYIPAIDKAYEALENKEKGNFAKCVAKELVIAKGLQETLLDRLKDIGWTINQDGELSTLNALLSEQFFPAGTQHDAYIAIRDILKKATSKLVVVDPYLRGNFFTTISGNDVPSLSIQLLTNKENLKSDFDLEASKYRQQYKTVKVEVRNMSDFHDRFIIVDEIEYYHVGASIEHAGTRAFMISRLQDEPILKSLKEYIDNAWKYASVVL